MSVKRVNDITTLDRASLPDFRIPRWMQEDNIEFLILGSVSEDEQEGGDDAPAAQAKSGGRKKKKKTTKQVRKAKE